ncbi:MAG: hypothetical protein MK193_09675 [Lentisphaeria bacterium]|nr:hypothetical protein [Lentisphaeria bacterium]
MLKRFIGSALMATAILFTGCIGSPSKDSEKEQKLPLEVAISSEKDPESLIPKFKRLGSYTGEEKLERVADIVGKNTFTYFVFEVDRGNPGAEYDIVFKGKTPKERSDLLSNYLITYGTFIRKEDIDEKSINIVATNQKHIAKGYFKADNACLKASFIFHYDQNKKRIIKLVVAKEGSLMMKDGLIVF